MKFVPFVSKLDAPLLKLSRLSDFTLEDATKGVHIFGGIGSGKTSGSGKMLAGAYLRAGMGGLVTCVKPEEIELWKNYAATHGRSKALVIFDESEGFNFLAYEMNRQGLAGIGTVVECLMRVLEAAKRASPTASKGGGEPFWEDSMRLLLRYSLAPLFSALGSLRIADIVRFVNTAPGSAHDVADPKWQARSFLYSVMDAASRNPKVPMSTQALTDAINFWADAYVAIPEKTRGNCVISLTSTLDRFLHGRLAQAFCGKTTIVPEMSFVGGVTVLGMPTLTWNEDGIIGQTIYKFFWQRAVLGRNSLAEEHRVRPVFLWCDEAQETAHSFDGEFQGMCRGSRCCTVYLTQSLPTYYAKMGGDNASDDAHTLVGKFITHIYHANSCPETNEYASRMCGRVLTRRNNASSGSSQSFNVGMSAGNSANSGNSSTYAIGANGSNSSGKNSGTGNSWGDSRGRGSSENFSRGYSESMENVIEAGDFARLLQTGGKANGGIVSGVWFQGGRIFPESGTNMMIRRFRQ